MEIEPQWFVVHTRPSGEHFAAINLRRLGYWTFAPFERIKRRRKMPRGRFRVEVLEQPYFSRYIFAALTRSGQNIGEINQAEGVATVVSFAGVPLQIPDGVMTELMGMAKGASTNGVDIVGEVDTVRRKPGSLAPGTYVRIEENNPFAGFIAQVSLDYGNKIRVWLHTLGALREVELDPEAIGEVVSPPQ